MSNTRAFAAISRRPSTSRTRRFRPDPIRTRLRCGPKAGWPQRSQQIQAALARVDPRLRPVNVVSLEDHVARSLLQERMLATLAGFFGALALLAGSGGDLRDHGVPSSAAAKRDRDSHGIGRGCGPGDRHGAGADGAADAGGMRDRRLGWTGTDARGARDLVRDPSQTIRRLFSRQSRRCC